MAIYPQKVVKSKGKSYPKMASGLRFIINCPPHVPWSHLTAGMFPISLHGCQRPSKFLGSLVKVHDMQWFWEVVTDFRVFRIVESSQISTRLSRKLEGIYEIWFQFRWFSVGFPPKLYDWFSFNFFKLWRVNNPTLHHPWNSVRRVKNKTFLRVANENATSRSPQILV